MNNYNKRREFLITTGKVAGFGLFAGAFSSVITSCEQDELPPKPKPGESVDLDLTQYPTLLVAGSAEVITIEKINGGSPILVKHNADGTFTVMDALCRHQNCNLILPGTSEGMLVCACHQATYSYADGKVIDNKGFATAVDLQNFIAVYDAGKKILNILA
ncbi:MAG: Rieske 2Fe-2S domain-containing protein [Candidatus Kapabacteria bacterium]|nr:Rieske 2Fe-2S domain-containing protein [Candidatus Kapabacteria bacterium]